MSKERNVQSLIILFTDIVSMYVSIVLAFYTRIWLGNVFALVPLGHGLSLYLDRYWMVLVTMVSFFYYGAYGIVVTIWDDFLRLLRGIFISFLIVWVLLSLQKEAETVSRIIVTLSFAYMVGLTPIYRFVLKFFLYKTLDHRRPTYLYERRTGQRESTLAESLNKEWYSGYEITGTIGKDTLKGKIDTCFVPIEYADDNTVKILKPKIKNLIIVSALSGLSFMGTDIKTFLSKNMALITTSNGLLSVQRVFVKRLLDITFALFGLLVFSPLLLIIPVLIRIDSKGPVFFTHRRCGKNLKEFYMFKFRTMCEDGERVLAEYIKKNPGALSELQEKNKIEKDPRVTRVGRLLRKISLDELPQLFNVLKGDMSIVGPRPDSKAAIEKYYHEYEEIYENVRPGITGLWQVSGRSDVNYALRVKLDYIYVLNWSLWLEFVIVLKTFRAICSGRGAY